MLFNSDFADNTIFLWFFFFFLIIDLYFLILRAIEHIFNTISKFVIPIGIPSKDAKAETDVHPVFVEAEIRKCSI